MAVLFDTTVPVVLIRQGRGESPPKGAEDLIAAARHEIESSSAVLPAVSITELLIGESSVGGRDALAAALLDLPTVVFPAEAARDAGVMGSFLRASGRPIPLPDLLIAATALWLEVPLLAWDGDYARSRDVAAAAEADHEGAGLWRQLRLHPASRSR